MLKIQILERVVPLPQILSQRERLGIQNSSIMSYVYYNYEIWLNNYKSDEFVSFM